MTVGRDGEDSENAGSAGTSGAGGAGAFNAPSGGSGGTTAAQNEALSVSVQDIEEMTVELITLSCEGDCADVEAVARGGHPLYRFEWSDGPTTAQRHICFDEDSELTVTVTDTGIASEEFQYDAQTADAKLTVDVLDCTDAGTPEQPSGDFCVDNPSLEGEPGVAEITGFILPSWTMCTLSPNVEPGGGGSTIPASDGETYLGALDAVQDLLNENASGSFCAPPEPGRPISFQVDLAVTAFNNGPVKLELWGGGQTCARDELLWTSPVINHVDTWQTYCATITPSGAFTHLTTWPVLEGTVASYVIVDNFRSVSSCPD